MMAPTAITQALEHFLEAAWHRTAMLNRKMIGLAHSNLKFSFELARAKTLSDVLSLQAGYWQEQVNALQAEDFADEFSDARGPLSAKASEPRKSEAIEPLSADAGEPLNAEASEPLRPDQETVRPQAKATIVASPLPVVAPEMPKQKSPPRPPQKAVAPASQGEGKGAKGRTKPAPGRPSSSEARAPDRNEARAAERKGRARASGAVTPGGTDKIQFGTLDGNAVRFTGTEAWALLDGAWRKVPADEVLSEAVVLSQARFEQRYPDVPQLPAAAFRPKVKR